jgi:hypothetical protein
MIVFLLLDISQDNMKLRRNLITRLRCLNEKKKKVFKINERKNKTVVFHYNKNEITEYFKEMKEICKENIRNRRQIKLEMFLEKRAAIKKS